jgi:thymidylate synthase
MLTDKISTSNISAPSPCSPDNSNAEENQYLDLISFVLNKGTFRGDRTGTGCYSYFAPPAMRFNLQENKLPLLTTKRVPVRHVFEELMWFIRGQTDANILKEKGISIWDGNASRDFLDSVGLTQNRDGDLGSVYGFQWRHFGANYVGVEGDEDRRTGAVIDYSGQGIDQLRDIVHKIRNNPTDRRILLSAWNPAGKKEMVNEREREREK